MEYDITLITNILNVILFIGILLLGKRLKNIEKYYALAESVLMYMLKTLVMLNNLLMTVREAVSDGKIERNEAEKIIGIIEEIISEWVNIGVSQEDSTEAPPQG